MNYNQDEARLIVEYLNNSCNINTRVKLEEDFIIDDPSIISRVNSLFKNKDKSITKIIFEPPILPSIKINMSLCFSPDPNDCYRYGEFTDDITFDTEIGDTVNTLYPVAYSGNETLLAHYPSDNGYSTKLESINPVHNRVNEYIKYIIEALMTGKVTFIHDGDMEKDFETLKNIIEQKLEEQKAMDKEEMSTGYSKNNIEEEL